MSFTVIPTAIPEVVVLEPKVFEDERGSFFEAFNLNSFICATGLDVQFVQDNHSISKKGVLRGLHYQLEQPQGKLVRVLSGVVFDVVVDLRRQSSSYKKWVGVELSSKNQRQIWVPPGFAHGFLVLSDWAELLYKVTDYWHPPSEYSLLWNDASIGIIWPSLDAPLIQSAKDASGFAWDQAPKF